MAIIAVFENAHAIFAESVLQRRSFEQESRMSSFAVPTPKITATLMDTTVQMTRRFVHGQASVPRQVYTPIPFLLAMTDPQDASSTPYRVLRFVPSAMED